jgi:type VI secretion system secreted protein Hcp
MAQDYFLKIDGLDGESQDDTHKDEIHILSFHMGAVNQGAGHRDGGSGAGRSSIHDMQLTKRADKSSPGLFAACAGGKHFPEATLTVRKAGENPLEYLVYKMTNVFVSSFNSNSHGAGDIAQESLSLNFSKIEMTYTPQNADGTPGAQIVKTHDIAANKTS